MCIVVYHSRRGLAASGRWLIILNMCACACRRYRARDSWTVQKGLHEPRGMRRSGEDQHSLVNLEFERLRVCDVKAAICHSDGL